MKKITLIGLLTGFLLIGQTIQSSAEEAEELSPTTKHNTAVSSSDYIRINQKEIEVGTELSELTLDVSILSLHAKEFVLDIDYSELNLEVVGDYTVYTELTFKEGFSETLKTEISVVDSIAPEIELQPSITIEVNSDFPDWYKYVKVRDNYYLISELQVDINDDSLDVNTLGTYKVEVLASDPSQNISTAFLTIDVVDTTKPYVSKNEPITVEVFSALEDLNVSDYIEFLDNYDEELIQIYDDSKIDVNHLGEYDALFTVTDTSGNELVHTATVQVVDSIEPVIEGFNDIKIKQGDSFNPLEGITANDQYDGDLTSQLKVVSEYDSKKPGKQDITLEVSDRSGNKSTVTYELTVERTIVNKESIRYVGIGAIILVAVVVITRKRKSSKKNSEV